ncbi:Fc.00g046810.m01.CDS01 [Cosmosporella sp. VM-42]
MAKNKRVSIHSRAARRATSPSIDTDKSLKDVVPPSRSAPHRPSVLAAQHSAGVSKKTKHRKSHMSAKAKRRHEKGLEMAEAVIERTSVKYQKSLGRGRVVKERSKDWDAINKNAVVEDKGGKGEVVEDGWETDEEMDGAPEGVLAVPATVAVAPEAAEVPLPTMDDDEEIL